MLSPDPKQLTKGIKVEHEHTDSNAIAAQIARDHLQEIPDYYTRLSHMEQQAKREGVMKTKESQASLDLALGHLWAQEGPGQTKHAAANYFGYRINKQERDQDTLGQKFCKVANYFHKDPWDLATEVVNRYPELEKTAKNELSRFYLGWADEMIKRAGPLSTVLNVVKRGLSSGKQLAVKAIRKIAPAEITAVEHAAPTAIRGGRVPMVAPGVLEHQAPMAPISTQGGRGVKSALTSTPVATSPSMEPLVSTAGPGPTTSGPLSVTTGGETALSSPVKKPTGLGSKILGGAAIGGAGLMAGAALNRPTTNQY